MAVHKTAHPGGKAFNYTPGAVAGGCPDGNPSIGPFCSPPIDPATGLPTAQGNLVRNALRWFGLGRLGFLLCAHFHPAIRRPNPAKTTVVFSHRAYAMRFQWKRE